MTTLPEEAVKAAQNQLSRTISEWERNREFLNVSPDAKKNFMRRQASALTAALPFLPVQVAVKVKELPWKDTGDRDQGRNSYAQTRIGRYEAFEMRLLKETIYGWSRGCGDEKADSFEAAKAAAQADYEARILSALEPTAARELALEEEFATIRAMIYCYEGDSAQAFEAQKALANIWNAIRVLSSPDHADAGKVEGDGWLPIESAPKDGTVIQVWHQVHKCPVSVLWKDDGFPYRGKRLNWYERTYTTAWPEHVFFYWRPLPSAPSQEVAGS